MTIQDVDLALSASWIIPVVPEGRIFENCSLIVNAGRIIDIVPSGELASRFRAAEHLELPGQALIPGLINAHGHAAMSLLRGYADDLPLMTWLEQHIWPAEAQWVDEAFVSAGTRLAIAEMLLSGTTCFSDMYFFPDAAAAVAHETGVRAQISFPVLDFPTAWAKDADEYIHKGLQLHDRYRSNDRISIGFGPHAPYTVSDAPLERIVTYAAELQSSIQIHLHETEGEVTRAVAEHGERPLARMNRLGLLGPATQCVHMTSLNEDDIDTLAASGAHVVHCPSSNLKLASGTCPTARLLERGINVALGTDGAASNNTLSLFSEARLAALLAKAHTNDAAVLSAEQTLYMATMGGARALGISEETGSLEPGKAADVCAVDLNDLRHQPVYHPVSQLIYTECSQSVTHVWVNGKSLVKNRQLTHMSMLKLIEDARAWKEKIHHD